MLTGVQDVYLNVQHMDRAVAFYRDILGMRVLDSHAWWTSLDYFGTRIGLHGRQGEAVPEIPHDEHGPHCGATLTLRSTDLPADVAYLRACGVRVLSTAEHGWGRLAVFRDSEGNVLKLMQPPEAR